MAYLSVHWKNSSSEERWMSMDGAGWPEGLWLMCWWQLMSLPASLLPISQELVTLDHSLRSVTDVHWPTFGVMNCIIYLHSAHQVSSLKGSGVLGSLSAQRAFLGCCGWQKAASVCQELPRGDIWNTALQFWALLGSGDSWRGSSVWTELVFLYTVQGKSNSLWRVVLCEVLWSELNYCWWSELDYYSPAIWLRLGLAEMSNDASCFALVSVLNHSCQKPNTQHIFNLCLWMQAFFWFQAEWDEDYFFVND